VLLLIKWITIKIADEQRVMKAGFGVIIAAVKSVVK